MKEKSVKQKKGIFNGFLNFVERVGNKLPHPATIFVILSVVVIIVSEFAARAGLSATYYDAKEKADVSVQAISLLNGAGLRYMFDSATKNFTGFAPLGTVLVAMLGVGVAEETGLIGSTLKKVVLSTPKKFITAVVVFMGIMSNVASDAGYVVLIPLGAIVFLSFNRHPLAGLTAAFAGVSAGFSANLLVGTIDPMLAGITNEAIKIGGSDLIIAPTANYYFMFASTFLLTIVGTLVTEKIVEPRLGTYTGPYKVDTMQITPEERKGLRMAGIALLLFIVVFAFLTVPQNGLLRTAVETEKGIKMDLNPFIHNGLVPTIALFFLIPGVVYGIATKNIKNDKDIIKGMSKSMASMGGYLVLAFMAAQFVNYFNYTKLGILLALGGANLLKSIGFQGLPLVVSFVLVSAFINLFIGSASAKWAIMAPIFVPMLMLLGISPDFTQLAYRIGDSTTNIISPLMTYFAVIVTFAQKYDEDTGIGTLISSMLPYSISFLISWTILMIIWHYAGLPIGY
ncbi:MAG: AbgT family transporter [Peptostreptococcaceae bacterium]|nr:AbgT family transporter [Peptostreptococcaceae bacterium]